jgi:hypothetical protein
MQSLSPEIIQDYRFNTFHINPRLRLNNERDAIRFVNERGFVLFWPAKGILLPSLWNATVGDRPVPNNHDDPGHITWNWKDHLLDRKKWYYGRVLRKRNTIISLELVPYFYALSPNYGDPENDYLIQYEQGLLPMETKNVFEALLKQGPLDSLTLRRVANLSSRGSDSRFNKALDQLQADFRILPVGIAEAGTWHYAFIYELVHRYFPKLLQQAHEISESKARLILINVYLHSVGACPENFPQRLFKWNPMETQKTINKLIEDGDLKRAKSPDDNKMEWITLPELVRELN